MKNFLEETATHKTERTAPANYWRSFFFILAVALLWQMISLVQLQISNYHQTLANDFKVILSVSGPLDNETLTGIGEQINAMEEVQEVKLFSPQDGLKVLQGKNPRLIQALLALGREPMPAYFELRLNKSAIASVQALTQQLATQYPQLSVKYSQEQANWVLYSGLGVRTLNIAAALALVFFLIFMFMVEAYPVTDCEHSLKSVWVGLLAGMLALGCLALLVYPTGLLSEDLRYFSTWERQVCLLVFCSLLGWTLGKWQKF